MTAGSNGDVVHRRQATTLLRRRWRLIAVGTLTGGVLFGAAAFMMPPRYTAKAQILQETEYFDGATVPDAAPVQTLVELMLSPKQLRNLATSLSKMDAGSAQRLPGYAELEDRLHVFSESHSRMISVTFVSKDPVVASTVVNRAIEVYLGGAAERLQNEQKAALDSLAGRLETARQDADRANADLRAFRLAHGMTGADRVGEIDTQIALMTQRLEIARADLAAKEALLKPAGDALLKRGAENSPSRTATASISGTDPGDGVLRNIGLGTSDAATVASENFDQLTRERSDAQARLGDIEARLEALRAAAAVADEQQKSLNGLERKVAGAEEVVKNLTQREADLVARGDGRPPARIVSLATPPQRQSSPNPLLFLFPALVGSALLSSMMALHLENSDQRLRSEKDVERALQVPCLGLVPKRTGKPARVPTDILPSDTLAPYTEAIRAVTVAATKRAGSGKMPRSFLFTSSAEGDGATTLAVSFALYAARLNRRVLLVDLNFRRPRIIAALGEPEPDELDIRTVRSLGIDYVQPPRREADPVAILTGANFSAFLGTVVEDYDCVVIDSAPAASATETRILATMVDRILLVTKWGATNARAARSAIDGLKAIGAHAPISVIINQADTRRHARYRYDEGSSAWVMAQSRPA